ncbi:MAG: tripartite tricarboxylate transporter substrate binding protein [Pseudomonadota bacterium]|nr:tripartite tricarboxylate transporter substrate binding protein [Pseudomonadota bacterium]
MVLRLLFTSIAIFAFAAQAQTYPTRPVRLVVGFEAGGNTDTVARVVGQKLAERLGQQVVIENKTGASGTIGTAEAARAAPDGYTLTMGTTTTHAIAPAAYSKLAYDPIADFEPIAMVAIAPYMLVVHPSFPAKDLKEFVSVVKAQPGKFNFGSAGQATTTHLVMATLTAKAGLDMVHIPFKGNAPATTAVLGNQVEILFGALPPLLTHVAAGKLRALAISSGKRSPSAPDVPTVAEAGFPGFDMALWLGFFAPKGTPAAIIKRLEAELLHVARSPELKAALEKQGLEANPLGAAELSSLLKSDIETYKSVFQAAKIPVQ